LKLKKKHKINYLILIQKFKVPNNITKIGFADCVTLHQIDAINLLLKLKDIEIINPFERDTNGKYKIFGRLPKGKMNLPKNVYEEKVEKLLDMMRNTLLSDIFITGANAITMDGKIVSTDGTGNRVAGTIFGPKKVILVVGRNKIVVNLDEAISRNRNIAAPLNSIRHLNKHHNRFEDLPCVKLGYCVDCNHPRITCNITTIIEGATEINKDRIHLIIVNEDLGL